jgi:hypothetical protein
VIMSDLTRFGYIIKYIIKQRKIKVKADYGDDDTDWCTVVNEVRTSLALYG